MFCKNCGKEIPDNSVNCQYCGYSMNRIESTSEDSGGFLWCLLGFCVPVVGLILYLIWKDEKPLTAKQAGKGALISVIAGVVLTILYFIFVVVIIGIAGSSAFLTALV